METGINLIKKLLPDWMHRRLLATGKASGMRKYSVQTGWLFIGRMFTFGLSFFMVAIVARYLGPDNLGKISYAQSFIAIFSLFASFGIDQIVSRDLTARPEDEYKILGTAFSLKLIFGVLTTIVAGIVAYVTSTDAILTWLIWIISLTFIVQPFGVASGIFTARVKGKYTAIIQIVLAIIIQGSKLLIIFFGKGVLFFAGALLLEAIITALLSLIFYVRVFRHAPTQWSFDAVYGKMLMLTSWPLLFAGVSSYIFGQIDKIMIEPLLGTAAVGLYASAVTVTQILGGFLPGILIGALTPALVNAYQTDMHVYHRRLRSLTTLSVGISLCIALLVFLLAKPIIFILYGDAFAGTVPVLHVFVWSTVLAAVMNLANQHHIIASQTKTFLIISSVTAVTNVGLNYFLISSYGIIGAAYATLISFALYITLSLSVYLSTKNN